MGCQSVSPLGAEVVCACVCVPAMRGCIRVCPGGAMAVNPSVARGNGTYAGPGEGRGCWEEEPVVVETRGRGEATPGVDWT